MKYYLYVLKNYANFSGRARRSEYWYFVLFNVLFGIAASIIDILLGTTVHFSQRSYTGYTENYMMFQFGYIYLIYTLVVLIPALAVLVRRLHDIGKSGWFFLILLIPLIGAIWLLVLLFTDSKPGENKWGPNPKGIGNHSEIDQIGSYLQN